MADKSNFTAEEWATLLKAPAMAGLAIVAADPSGPFGAIKESFATGKALAEVKLQGGANALIDAVVQDIATPEGREIAKPSGMLGASLEEAQANALNVCRNAADIVTAKAPDEAAAFKQWLMSISQRVAEASKEGGFLGFGGILVSEQEQAALHAISGALGL
jgi:hypothetical protein